jgi:hypothetical protein
MADERLGKFSAPRSSRKPRIPMSKHQKTVLSARHGGGHPVTDHKIGGYRMTGMSGKKTPFEC